MRSPRNGRWDSRFTFGSGILGGLAPLLCLTTGAALLDCSLLVTTSGLTTDATSDATASEARFDGGSADPAALDSGAASANPHGDAAVGTADAGLADTALSDAGSDADTEPTRAVSADAAPEAAADSAPGAECGAGRIVCNGSCVDPTTDPLNCNGCGNVCNDGQCGTSIAADMRTAPPSSWVFNGSATYSASGPSAAMTAADVLYQAGTITYRQPIAVDSFTATFGFRMGYGGGTRNDGMGFMFQKTGPTAVSGSGQALAMEGLDGYAVEFDIVNNGACGELSNDHIGVDWLASCAGASGLPTSLFSTDVTGVVDLADAQWHQAIVTMEDSALSVQVDGATYATRVSLTGFVPGTPHYLGFAGATGGNGGPDGGGGYQTEVKDVVVTFPTPRCL